MAAPFPRAQMMASARLHVQASGLLLQQQLCPTAPLSRRLRRARPSGKRTQRTVVRIEAVAAPEKTTTSGAAVDFRAWDSPSARTVKKRDDLKKWVGGRGGSAGGSHWQPPGQIPRPLGMQLSTPSLSLSPPACNRQINRIMILGAGPIVIGECCSHSAAAGRPAQRTTGGWRYPGPLGRG